MKKLMTIAAAALCASVFADGITSANVVGYQNKDASLKQTLYLGTFLSTSKGTDMTLGDISANSFNDEDGDVYGVYDWTGFLPFGDFIQTISTSGKFTGKYTYVPQGYVGDNEAGWYEYSDKTTTTPMNSVSLPFTRGFILSSGNGNDGLAPKLLFAGAVKADATVVTVSLSSLVSGNCSPVDITLGGITANSFNDEDGDSYGVYDWTGFLPFGDFIQVMNDSGKFIGKYTYAPAGYKNGNIAGWYEFTDKECTNCVNDAVTIKAGQAFLVVAGNGNDGLAPTITIPTALK